MTSSIGDQAVQRALRKRRELEQEIRQIDLFVSLYEQFAGHPVSHEGVDAAESLEVAKPKTRPRKYEGGGMSQEDFIALARELLLEVGRPVNGPTLLQKFREKGRRIGGADEMRNLTTKVWRARDKIIKIPGAGYWPIDVPCPAVSYVPASEGVDGEEG